VTADRPAGSLTTATQPAMSTFNDFRLHTSSCSRRYYVIPRSAHSTADQFTKYRTIYLFYHNFIVRSTYDSDFRRDKIYFTNVVSQFTNTTSDDLTILHVNCT